MSHLLFYFGNAFLFLEKEQDGFWNGKKKEIQKVVFAFKGVDIVKNNILLRTNIFVCSIIIFGFIITSITSYHSNLGVFEKDAEHVTDLAAEGIYYQVDSIFTKPINVSLTMANDNLLRDFLSKESSDRIEDEFIKKMRDYLYAYHEKYAYDSVFLASTKTNRYYHYNGLDRILEPNNPENDWYYDFISSGQEYSLNIDNDEAGENEITIFVNCKIKNSDGAMIGIIGVGFHVDYLQELLKNYEEEFDVQTYLIDKEGIAEVSTQYTGYEKVDLFQKEISSDLKELLLAVQKEPQALWHTSKGEKEYIVSRYIENLDWHLIVKNDTLALNQHMRRTLLQAILVICVIVFLVLLTITIVIQKYNKQIIELTTAKEREYYQVRQDAAKQLYENIYELDITHNCAVGENTKHYFESLGVPAQTPYADALKIIAAKQIKKEYQQGYLDTFTPENVLKAYENGIKSLSYNFMNTNDGKNYYWMRIIACIFFWSEDNSIRMTTYRQNIDEEKKKEKQLLAQMQCDPLTGLYNKAVTEEKICEILGNEPTEPYAFFILDIDNFKRVNDTMGHSVGDYVIAQFAQILKRQFQNGEIIGRIGGDEFVVFLQTSGRIGTENKAQAIVNCLHTVIMTEAGKCNLSASIGIAIYPSMGIDFKALYKNADLALYQTKECGKNGYTIYNGLG